MANKAEQSQTSKHAGGRPRSKSPTKWAAEQLQQIDEMAEAQAKDCMIAEVLGVDAKTFQKEFSKRTRQKRAQGKRKVLQAQFRGCLAEGAGAVTERIWFGKQHLEQSDKSQVEHSGKIGISIEPTREEWDEFLADYEAAKAARQ